VPGFLVANNHLYMSAAKQNKKLIFAEHPTQYLDSIRKNPLSQKTVISPVQLRVIYKCLTVDSADMEKIQQELDRAFDTLFEATAADELMAGEGAEIPKENKVFLPSQSTVDNSAQLRIQ
jgi:hypothetical protein